MKALKFVGSVVIVVVAVSLLNLWYQTFIVGAYYANAGIGLRTFGYCVPAVLIVGAFYAVMKVIKLNR